MSGLDLLYTAESPMRAYEVRGGVRMRRPDLDHPQPITPADSAPQGTVLHGAALEDDMHENGEPQGVSKEVAALADALVDTGMMGDGLSLATQVYGALAERGYRVVFMPDDGVEAEPGENAQRIMDALGEVMQMQAAEREIELRELAMRLTMEAVEVLSGVGAKGLQADALEMLAFLKGA